MIKSFVSVAEQDLHSNIGITHSRLILKKHTVNAIFTVWRTEKTQI